jgi:hypothetical protein
VRVPSAPRHAGPRLASGGHLYLSAPPMSSILATIYEYPLTNGIPAQNPPASLVRRSTPTSVKDTSHHRVGAGLALTERSWMSEAPMQFKGVCGNRRKNNLLRVTELATDSGSLTLENLSDV